MNFREKRWVALAVVCVGQLMMILDAAIVTVALPAIKGDLGFSASSLTWVPNAYLISFGALLLLGGRLGDLVGRRTVFLAGIALFTIASLACGLSETAAELIIARFVQGVGAAISASAILALIVVEFPEPADRLKAMSAYTFVSVAGGSIGLLAGGLLTQGLNWHWIFYVNIPLGIATYVAGRMTLSRDQGLGFGKSVDILGSVLITVASVLGIYAIVGADQYGFGSVRTLGIMAVALVLLGAFFAVERRAADPILPLGILRLRSLIVGCIVRGFMVCGIWGVFFMGAQYLERVQGMGPIAAGAAFLPQTLMVAFLSAGQTARLMGRFGGRAVLLFGLTALTAGLAVYGLQTTTGASYFPGLFGAYLLIGLGAGTSFMTLATLSLADVPAADAGIGSGLVNVSTQIAAAFGLAVLGTISADHSNSLAKGGDSALHALAGGYQLGMLIAAGCVAVGLLITVVAIRPSREREREPAVTRAVAVEA